MARVKENNQFLKDHSFPGICSLCFDEIADFMGSNDKGRPIITRLKKKYRMASVELDDGSRMSVSLCKICFNGFNGDDAQELMENEINGWQDEVDNVVEWEPDHKIDHMAKYSKRHITNRADKPFDIVEQSKIKKPRTSRLRVKTKRKKRK